MKNYLINTAVALCISTSMASAEDWTLNEDTSRLAFSSVKNSYTGEVHTFEGLSGSVSDSGDVSIDIPLSGVATNIDIRNERMVEFVFNNTPTATLTASLDLTAVEALAPGETLTMEMVGTLAFLGSDVDVYTEVFVARMAEQSILVTTNDMMFLDTELLGVDAGIDKLQELASLDSITRAVPITARFVFEN